LAENPGQISAKRGTLLFSAGASGEITSAMRLRIFLPATLTFVMAMTSPAHAVPSALPLPMGAAQVQFTDLTETCPTSSMSNGGTTSYETDLGRNEIISFYDESLVTNGWKAESSPAAARRWNNKGDNRSVVVDIADAGSVRKVTVTEDVVSCEKTNPWMLLWLAAPPLAACLVWLVARRFSGNRTMKRARHSRISNPNDRPTFRAMETQESTPAHPESHGT
jgi:hypothetical protein